MRRLGLLMALFLAGAAPASAADAEDCAGGDARDLLAGGDAALVGVLEAREGDRLTFRVERSGRVALAPRVVVAETGPAMALRVGQRTGLVLRRSGEDWRAGACELVPAARLTRAMRGREPCPLPRVRIRSLRVAEGEARLVLALGGDVTSVAITWPGGRREQRTLRDAGSRLVARHRWPRDQAGSVRVSARGGTGPGCGVRRP